MRFRYRVTAEAAKSVKIVAPRSDLGVVLVHGLNSTPHEMNGVALHLASIGCSVNSIRLRGHASHPRDLVGVTWHDWVEDTLSALEEMRSYHETVAIVGQCAGAVLALYAASVTAVQRIALTAPVLAPNGKVKALAPVIMRLGKQWRTWRPRPGEMEGVDWDGYYTQPISVHVEFMKLQVATSERLESVRSEVLIVRSKQDAMISDADIYAIRDRTQGEVAFCELEGGAHILTLNASVRSTVINEISQFLTKHPVSLKTQASEAS